MLESFFRFLMLKVTVAILVHLQQHSLVLSMILYFICTNSSFFGTGFQGLSSFSKVQVVGFVQKSSGELWQWGLCSWPQSFSHLPWQELWGSTLLLDFYFIWYDVEGNRRSGDTIVDRGTPNPPMGKNRTRNEVTQLLELPKDIRNQWVIHPYRFYLGIVGCPTWKCWNTEPGTTSSLFTKVLFFLPPAQTWFPQHLLLTLVGTSRILLVQQRPIHAGTLHRMTKVAQLEWTAWHFSCFPVATNPRSTCLQKMLAHLSATSHAWLIFLSVLPTDFLPQSCLTGSHTWRPPRERLDEDLALRGFQERSAFLSSQPEVTPSPVKGVPQGPPTASTQHCCSSFLPTPLLA